MINTTNKIARLRFIGHYTLSLNWILTSYLIFSMTGSITLAATLLTVETINQFLAYLFGGTIIKHFSQKKCHVALEYIKFLALSLLIVAAITTEVWLLFVSITLNTIAGALVNILTEVLVTQQWKDHKSEGHASMNSASLFGKVCGVYQLIAYFIFN